MLNVPDRPVLVETYRSRSEVEERLNYLAKDPDNRYDLKFFNASHRDRYTIDYTIVLIWTPE